MLWYYEHKSYEMFPFAACLIGYISVINGDRSHII